VGSASVRLGRWSVGQSREQSQRQLVRVPTQWVRTSVLVSELESELASVQMSVLELA